MGILQTPPLVWGWKYKEVHTMSMDSKVKELRELKRLAEELQAEIEAAQDAIKAEMTAQAVDTLSGADWKVTWKEVISSRLDTTALKKAMPDVAQAFTKATTTRRFCVA